ncbi:MAG: hypothetical protein HON65_03010, partial [Rhodospirillales bacterium]|nr:hypothetical protein [Rhodospirillales bacterium]
MNTMVDEIVPGDEVSETATAEELLSATKFEQILTVIDDICQGDFESRISDITLVNGMERMLCLKINEMIDRADAYIRESTACMEFVARNRYFRRVASHGMLGDYKNAVNGMNKAADSIESKIMTFGEMVETISAASPELNASAQSMGETASHASSRATTVAAAAEEAGSNTETVAAAAEELNSSIQEINRQVSQSAVMASDAVIEAENANDLVNGLSESSTRIEQVVTLINDIAKQTNLLA